MYSCFLCPKPSGGLIYLSWYLEKMFDSMMASSNGNIFRVTGPLCGEFTGPGEFPTQRPVTRSFDVFFDRRLNKRSSKQPRGWWLETLSCSLWRQSNANSTTLHPLNYAQLCSVGNVALSIKYDIVRYSLPSLAIKGIIKSPLHTHTFCCSL